MPFTVASPPATMGGPDTPLVVDMDGTMLRTDTLVEGLVAALFRNPLGLVSALPALLKGRAAFKRRVSALVDLDVASLPVRQDLLAHIHSARAQGRQVHLVSAADHVLVERVAAHLGVFDSAAGSQGDTNLKSARKAEYLVERFPQGFAYAGDAAADLKVWRHATGIVLAGVSGTTRRRAAQLGRPVESEFADARVNRARTWLKALRVHQWSKNVLLLVPLALSGQLLNLEAWALALAGFLALGLTASGTYILNDLSDLSADRRHRSKHARPFASCALPVWQGVIAAPALILGGLGVALVIAPAFAAALVGYVCLTLSYSLRLKRIALLDVFVLAGLYTTRILMGMALLNQPASAWLLTFSMFFFLSMSLAKRHVEVAHAAEAGVIPGRGYQTDDAPVTLSFGIGAAIASTLILVLYLVDEAFPSGIYKQPNFLWAAPLLLSAWSMRIWLLAHRGTLDDDPVAFALKDKVSLVLGLLLAIAFGLAWAV
jgi:4-hydroxybenzoate polyprenyltransferase